MKYLHLPLAIAFALLLSCDNLNNKHNLSPILQTQLDSIYYKDQHLRKLIRDTTNQNIEALQYKIESNDSLNRIFISNLLRNHGWPEKDCVDYRGHKTIFLVIQHSPPDFQRQHYQFVEHANKAGLIEDRSMALLIDRLSLDENGFQVYGTQLSMNDSTKLFSLYPLKDTTNIDSLRETMGLSPLSEYLNLWDMSPDQFFD